MKAILLLKDGTVFQGTGFGASGTVTGEVVFNTAMTGYQEVLTDPSYKGQMVAFTYPHIGNYGINPEDAESVQTHVEAMIVKDVCRVPSNFRSAESLDSYLKRVNVCGIYGIDTRQLTRHIRDRGAMQAILSTECFDIAVLTKQLEGTPEIAERDLVAEVTTDTIAEWKTPAAREWYYEPIDDPDGEKVHIVAFDFGVKHTILKLMKSLGMKVTVVPASTNVTAVRDLKPDGIFLSNGPGDPETVDYAIKTVKALAGEYPIFGICLGHQILALALGAETFKLPFGHHGSNHPVKNLETGRISITAQNHNYAVDQESMEEAGFIRTHMNLNDDTVEGMKHRSHNIFSIQYHPEASPGPHDAVELFRQFKTLIVTGS